MPITPKMLSPVARYLIGLALLFGASTWMAGTQVAAAVVGSFVAGYLIEFHLVRSILSFLRGS
jgi:hypothetical protein